MVVNKHVWNTVLGSILANPIFVSLVPVILRLFSVNTHQEELILK